MSEIAETFASLDLGSNSFHMLVASYLDGRQQVIDRLKETVRLASGLDEQGYLSDQSMYRALECLERFGQRLREIPKINVRVVGTNTLRQAKNGHIFLRNARQALGHPIEIVSGLEEARLIYLGVAHAVFNESEKRLVVDIGGGSTELIIGRGYEPHYAESLYMGCVSMTRRMFSDGEITRKKMRKAVLNARQELESVETTYRRTNWDHALGSSGTILAVNEIVRQQGWSEDGITPASLNLMQDAMISTGTIDKLNFAGLSETRKPVIAGGVAVLLGVFEALQIDIMQVADGALREGLLHDLIGRFHNEDVRDRTVRDLAQRYNVDQEQSSRVRKTVETLFHQVQQAWQLKEHADLQFLRWGAEIHEIGLSIAHSQHHRHGAYLVANSDMAGFSRQDQTILAALVVNHRRKFISTDDSQFSEDIGDRITRLSILLRLSVVLNRSRLMTALPAIQVKVSEDSIKLKFPENWLDGEPLTIADLDLEASYIAKTGITLKYQ